MDAIKEQVEQVPLLDLTGKEFNAMWVDESQPLFVANNPLHWRAHKLQIALKRMERQQEQSPQQFNATAYFSALEKLGDLMEQINKKGEVDSGEILDAGGMAEIRNAGAAAAHSEIEPISMDS